MPTTEEFVAAARNWIGTRWLHQGRNRQGVDCVGLVVVAAADVGIQVQDAEGYRRTAHKEVFLKHIRDQTEFIPQPEPGCIGIFRDGTQPCHVAIFGTMYDKLSLIHANGIVGKVVEELFIHEWPQALIETRKIKELT